MTPEQKITRMSGLCARLVSLVCAADAILPTDKNAGYSLLNEALAHSREIRELRSPSTQENGVPPNLAIMDGEGAQPGPLQPTVAGALQAAGHTPEFSATVVGALQDFSARLTAIEAQLGSNGGPPLIDPPTPSVA